MFGELRLCVVALICVLLNACTRPHSQETAVVQPTAAIIVIPGYKGSALSTESGERVWLTSSEIVFGSHTLALPNQETGVENVALKPDGILHRTPIVPYLFHYDIYDTLVQSLREELGPSVLVQEFSYDWRRDNLESIRELDSLVRQLRVSGVRTVLLVGHSMGGFITSYYLRYGTQDPDVASENWEGASLVSGAICVGVPYRGSLDIFLDMHTGVYTGPNDALLNTIALSSFPSSYQLIPSPTDDVLRPKADLHDVSLWQQQRWGLFSTKYGEQSPLGVKSFTERQLKRSQKMSTLMLSSGRRLLDSRVQLLNIVGQGRDTSVRAELPRGAEHTFVEKADGDGLVSVTSAYLPDGLRTALNATEVHTTARHGGMLADEEVQKLIVSFFRGVSTRH